MTMLHRPNRPRRPDPGRALEKVRAGKASDLLRPIEPPEALVASGRNFGLFAPTGSRWVYVPIVQPGRVLCKCPEAMTGDVYTSAQAVRFRTFEFNDANAVRWKVSLGQCERCFTVFWGGLGAVPIRRR
jgi:hypothetical protein